MAAFAPPLDFAQPDKGKFYGLPVDLINICYNEKILVTCCDLSASNK
ncbi:MAG TPA: hypothetical protein VGG71_15400 [Chitinophagaceae bacterium]